MGGGLHFNFDVAASAPFGYCDNAIGVVSSCMQLYLHHKIFFTSVNLTQNVQDFSFNFQNGCKIDQIPQ